MWPAAQVSAYCALLLQVIATFVSIFSSSGQVWLAGALLAGGMALLRGLVAWGLWGRARWSLWAGLAIALVSVMLFGIALALSTSRMSVAAHMTPISTALAWGEIAANGALLVSAVLILARAKP